MSETEKIKDGGIGSVGLVGQILQVIKQAERPLSLSEIAKGTGEPVARLYPYLYELSKAGMLSRNPLTMDYTLGHLSLRLGLRVLSREKTVRYLRKRLSEFSAFHRVNSFLTVLGPKGLIVIENYEYAKTLNTGLAVGRNLSFFSTATGTLFWAFLRPEQKESFLSQSTVLSESSIFYSDVDGSDKKDLFEEIRDKGYSLFIQKPIHNIDSLAFPFFNDRGEMIASVTLTMQSGQLNVSQACEWLAELKTEVDALYAG